jgi:hypothetical protein
MAIFPADDTFEEFSTHYGERLASYLRHRPWVTAGDAQTGYSIGNCVGDLHDGYSGASALAAFHGQGLTGTDSSMGAVLWRQEYLDDVKVALGFRAVAVSGSPTSDDFRWVGVCARVSGGSYTDSTGAQSIRDTSGYWLVLANTPGVPGVDAKWLTLRVNAGAITVLSTKGATAEVSAAMTSLHEMSLEVATVGGDVELTAYYDGVEVDSVTDSSGSKITTDGRCGFGMVRDRLISGRGIATVASYFSILDSTLGTKVLEDDFTRENLACNPGVTDGLGTDGTVLMSMWTLDIHGPSSWAGGSSQYRDAGLNRIRAEDGIYNFSQITATDQYEQTRSITYRMDV